MVLSTLCGSMVPILVLETLPLDQSAKLRVEFGQTRAVSVHFHVTSVSQRPGYDTSISPKKKKVPLREVFEMATRERWIGE